MYNSIAEQSNVSVSLYTNSSSLIDKASCVVKYSTMNDSEKLAMCGRNKIFKFSNGYWGDVIEETYYCGLKECPICNASGKVDER